MKAIQRPDMLYTLKNEMYLFFHSLLLKKEQTNLTKIKTSLILFL